MILFKQALHRGIAVSSGHPDITPALKEAKKLQ
ncbi:MAG: hypothetical protein ACI883_001570 [Candidatus Azotimanducaceae bacterium]|jgi:hypothetical protein